VRRFAVTASLPAGLAAAAALDAVAQVSR